MPRTWSRARHITGPRQTRLMTALLLSISRKTHAVPRGPAPCLLQQSPPSKIKGPGSVCHSREDTLTRGERPGLGRGDGFKLGGRRCEPSLPDHQ